MSKEDQEEQTHQCTLVCQKKGCQKDINFKDFQILMVLGRGAFGKVMLAQLANDPKPYAIKYLRKDQLISQNQIEHTLQEKEILTQCDHPFLVGTDYVFQSQYHIYFVMPFIRGGELYKIFKKKRRFKEETVKFYGAQLVSALGYLNSKNIIHRDLKLENILVDHEGYIRLIDYGLAKTIEENDQTKTYCGTPEYVAPEMVAKTGHNKEVDWWALGVLLYEMLIGKTPFVSRDRAEMNDRISKGVFTFPA